MGATALDIVTDPAFAEDGAARAMRDAARAQLAELCQRVEDLEILLRAAGDRELTNLVRDLADGWTFEISEYCSDERCEARHRRHTIRLEQGDGRLPKLPLNERVRAALKEAGGG